MVTTNDIKNGTILNLDGNLWQVVEFQHVKPGKGGAFVRTKMKNVMTGKTVDKTFNAGTKIDTATVYKKEMQYLYNDGSNFVFMDNETYEQVQVDKSKAEDAAKFILEGANITVAFYDNLPLFVELPASVELKVTTEPWIQGDRSSGGTKPATLETGVQVQVPLFINTGDVIKVETRTGEYISRVS
jgi:elongation factor P